MDGFESEDLRRCQSRGFSPALPVCSCVQARLDIDQIPVYRYLQKQQNTSIFCSCARQLRRLNGAHSQVKSLNLMDAAKRMGNHQLALFTKEHWMNVSEISILDFFKVSVTIWLFIQFLRMISCLKLISDKCLHRDSQYAFAPNCRCNHENNHHVVQANSVLCNSTFTSIMFFRDEAQHSEKCENY